MEMIPIDSAAIRAVGHDGENMHVEFKSGGVYMAPTSQAEFDAFMASKSKGHHFHSKLKNTRVWKPT